MLQVPDLDDITYDQLLQGAVHKIPLLTKEWTDFNRYNNAGNLCVAGRYAELLYECHRESTYPEIYEASGNHRTSEAGGAGMGMCGS